MQRLLMYPFLPNALGSETILARIDKNQASAPGDILRLVSGRRHRLSEGARGQEHERAAGTKCEG
ncbi:hypothetical protein [Trinickia sp. Y13]|uniref:hypothetical protein n=1 Tax=Trinickia sp. Y13 TaxID=2917807 RepID=UPI002406A422|nr:hypothetical protein [Trinickia sp. Y13]MDG0025850.1 hypothetical protein [Trinickia sp. Y13]